MQQAIDFEDMSDDEGGMGSGDDDLSEGYGMDECGYW